MSIRKRCLPAIIEAILGLNPPWRKETHTLPEKAYYCDIIIIEILLRRFW